ncbi:MAG: helix-turn-helix transcriptional regulator [Lachnospiraceae bacterium]|nr:helix-turn-helix transcriptional regulator [Lachnospiraceae bacterium]
MENGREIGRYEAEKMEEKAEIERKIGLQVRQRRIASGFSQEQLAELVDVSTTTISRLENGRQMVSVAKIVQISMVLKIGAGELFCDYDYEMAEKKNVDVRLEELLRACSPRQKEYFLDYLKQFLEYSQEQ